MAAHPSTALRFSESTRSKGGDAGDEALCRACSDCRHTVKHVQEPPAALAGAGFGLGGWAGRRLGVAVGLGKKLDGTGVEAWLKKAESCSGTLVSAQLMALPRTSYE